MHMGTKYLHTSHSSCIHIKHKHSQATAGSFKCTPLLSSRLQSDKLAACWLLASVPPDSGGFFTPFSPPAGQKVLETVSGTSWYQNSSCSAHTSHRLKIHPHRQIWYPNTCHHKTTRCKCIHIHTVWSLLLLQLLPFPGIPEKQGPNGAVDHRADRRLGGPRPWSKVCTLAVKLLTEARM